jgi:hypothetical protein
MGTAMKEHPKAGSKDNARQPDVARKREAQHGYTEKPKNHFRGNRLAPLRHAGHVSLLRLGSSYAGLKAFLGDFAPPAGVVRVAHTAHTLNRAASMPTRV